MRQELVQQTAPMFPTTPKVYITVAIVAASTAWMANSNGEINRKVNSSGSVMPTSTAVSVAGISRPATLTRFSGDAVCQIASAIPTEPNTLELPCSENPPSGNSVFSGTVLWLNS